MPRTPQVGEPAPDFELAGTEGTFKLSEHRGERVVLLFYPGDFTPVCTEQFCSYRDRARGLLRAGGDRRGHLRAGRGSRTSASSPRTRSPCRCWPTPSRWSPRRTAWTRPSGAPTDRWSSSTGRGSCAIATTPRRRRASIGGRSQGGAGRAACARWRLSEPALPSRSCESSSQNPQRPEGVASRRWCSPHRRQTRPACSSCWRRVSTALEALPHPLSVDRDRPGSEPGLRRCLSVRLIGREAGAFQKAGRLRAARVQAEAARVGGARLCVTHVTVKVRHGYPWGSLPAALSRGEDGLTNQLAQGGTKKCSAPRSAPRSSPSSHRPDSAATSTPFTPVASAAKNIPGRYQKSAEGLKAATAPYPCMSEMVRYNELVSATESFLLEGKTEGALAAGSAANNVYNKAQKGGCGWAA